MAETVKAKIGSPLFLHTVPGTQKRHWARRGDTVELTMEDYERLKKAGGVYKDKAPPPDTKLDPNTGDYDSLKVEAAIAYLETLPEDEREDYFEKERERKRKGVLLHFEQPLWEGADLPETAKD